MLSRLRVLSRRLESAWRAGQVELGGEYSAGRLVRLRNYCERTSTLRSLLVLVATPLPSLLLAVLIEAVPLRPPSDGLGHGLTLWLRAFLVGAESAFVAMQQCRWLVPSLPSSVWHVLVAAVLIGTGAAAATYSFARSIGFPLPFTLLFEAPMTLSLLAVSMLVMWGRFLARNRAERATLFSFFGVVGVQMSIAYVYPAFAFFNQLSALQQVCAMALLPVIKLLAKNIIAYFFRRQDDLKPVTVVLNIEIYHALFLSWSMNGTTSKAAVATLMLIDVLEGGLALLEVRRQLALFTAYRVSTDSVAGHERHSLLDEMTNIAIGIGSPLEQRTPSSVVGSSKAMAGPTATIARLGSQFNFDSIGLTGSTRIVPLPNAAPPTSGLSLGGAVPLLDSKTTPRDQPRHPSVFVSDENRRQFLRHALKLLHMTEFVLLIEFTEIVIPTTYNLYVLAACHLPNRAFLMNIRDLSLDQLLRSAWVMLSYSLLEIASLLLLGSILQRQTRMSSLRQLAFVLEEQWKLVQTSMVLRVVFAVQTPLEHYGADFSFRFAWLHH